MKFFKHDRNDVYAKQRPGIVSDLFQRFQGALQTESIKLTIKFRLRNHLGQKVIKWKICIFV